MTKFLRTDWTRFSRLGKGRKNKQKWRRARGKHSKIRRKRMGYPVMPTVGYKKPRSQSGLIHGLKPILVHNLAELKQADKNSIVILARIGAKKKLEMIKQAESMGIKILNMENKK